MQGPTDERLDPGNATHGMGLERCLVEGNPEETSGARRRSRKAFGASLTIEILLLALLVVTPLLTSVAQPQLKRLLPPQLAFFGPWRQPIQNQRVAQTSSTHNQPILRPDLPPPAIGVTARPIGDADRGIDPIPDVSGGGMVPGEVEIAGMGNIAPVQPPHVEQAPQQIKHPLKLSAGVVEAQLISRIEPAYPPLAVQTKREGAVLLHAIISKDGRITSLDVLNGDPLLVKAALDAVRQWRYRPTLLNGEPVEVETSITVIFRLRS